MFEEGVKTFQQCLGEVLKRVQHLSREVLKQVCEQRFNVNPRALVLNLGELAQIAREPLFCSAGAGPCLFRVCLSRVVRSVVFS